MNIFLITLTYSMFSLSLFFFFFFFAISYSFLIYLLNFFSQVMLLVMCHRLHFQLKDSTLSYLPSDFLKKTQSALFWKPHTEICLLKKAN